MTAILQFKGAAPANDELHRMACRYLHEADHAVFGMLPDIIAKIIDNKVWKSQGFENFGKYVLDQTSMGLGISNNQQLWLLKCSMDIAHRHSTPPKHLSEWGDVLVEVDRAVRIHIKEEGLRVRDFHGCSLDALGKAPSDDLTNKKITYLPSGSGQYYHKLKTGPVDSVLIRLRKHAPDIYRRVVAGEMTPAEGFRLSPLYKGNGDPKPLDRAIMLVKQMAKPDIKAFVAWLREQGHIE
jgi:hypothetical protein